ncbi:hypothetical protein [Desulfovibrio sp. ZJ200]|uniref:hypothetical protein n=1 Tax=Desulfovibrio sp. ZJ200 TaxID=2709792 RepID=UPI0013EA6F16|nr:hypothetical protein [Desulfovibrio sp. ZJ200]
MDEMDDTAHLTQQDDAPSLSDARRPHYKVDICNMSYTRLSSEKENSFFASECKLEQIAFENLATRSTTQVNFSCAFAAGIASLC